VASFLLKQAFSSSVVAIILAMREAAHVEVIMAFDYTGILPGDAMQLRLISKRVKELLPTLIPIIIEIGTHLEAAKRLLPHGRFGAYCDEEMGISDKSAQNYMNLARLARTRDPSDLAKLSAGAGYELAARNTPEPVVSEVLADVRAGLLVTEDDVKQRISVAKGGDSRAEASAVPDVGEIADLLLSALDQNGIVNIELFLRCAGRPLIKTLCGRLQQALNESVTTVSDLLPKNSLM
jgi:hypothetical protein